VTFAPGFAFASRPITETLDAAFTNVIRGEAVTVCRTLITFSADVMLTVAGGVVGAVLTTVAGGGSTISVKS
jgi:hypothetical protein